MYYQCFPDEIFDEDVFNNVLNTRKDILTFVSKKNTINFYVRIMEINRYIYCACQNYTGASTQMTEKLSGFCDYIQKMIVLNDYLHIGSVLVYILCMTISDRLSRWFVSKCSIINRNSFELFYICLSIAGKLLLFFGFFMISACFNIDSTIQSLLGYFINLKNPSQILEDSLIHEFGYFVYIILAIEVFRIPFLEGINFALREWNIYSSQTQIDLSERLSSALFLFLLSRSFMCIFPLTALITILFFLSSLVITRSILNIEFPDFTDRSAQLLNSVFNLLPLTSLVSIGFTIFIYGNSRYLQTSGIPFTDKDDYREDLKIYLTGNMKNLYVFIFKIKKCLPLTIMFVIIFIYTFLTIIWNPFQKKLEKDLNLLSKQPTDSSCKDYNFRTFKEFKSALDTQSPF